MTLTPVVSKGRLGFLSLTAKDNQPIVNPQAHQGTALFAGWYIAFKRYERPTMKKTWFAACLLLASFGAHAQWMYFGTDGDRADYINKSLDIQDASVKFWVIQDFKSAQTLENNPLPFLSQKNQYDINCAENRFKIISLHYYDKHMAAGNKVFSVTEAGGSLEIEPETFGEALRDFVCQ